MPPKSKEAKPLIDLSQDQQWDIINKTGVLHKIQDQKKEEEEEPHALIAAIMSVPMTLFYAMLDYVVHYQYDFLKEFTLTYVLTRHLRVLPTLAIFIYVTSRLRHYAVAQWLFCICGALTGCFLIYVTTQDETYGSMLQTPGMAVIWIYLVIQMDMLPSLVSLLATALYYFREDIVAFVDVTQWKTSFALPSNGDL